ncbi:MAG: hypothetical protein HDQ97_18280 [Lachnospiraceae bacterium]|nr:hypothetical protein [Lachnospiraceae bacterium]
MGKGLVIAESISSDFRVKLNDYIDCQYPHLLNHINSVTILRLEIKFEEFKNIALEIAEEICDDKYYAHFIFDDSMYVIYRKIVVKLNMYDDKMIRECQFIGMKKGIDMELMKFSELFFKDHPND